MIKPEQDSKVEKTTLTAALAQISLLSKVNRPNCSRTVVVHLLQFVGIGYLDRSITSL